ncbi:MAG: universal stress protein [Acidobacteriota bacterium]
MMTAKIERILVPTDFSETAGRALRYASVLADSLGASLAVVYSDPFVPPVDYPGAVGGWNEGSFAQMMASAEEQLQRDAEEHIDPSVLYDAIVRVAPTLDGILAQARESNAGLIVMGTHGRTGFQRRVIGSVTEAVLRHADIPVIAVPPRSDAAPSIRTIVCPVIYNTQYLAALTFAAQIAPPDARFIIVRTAPVDDPRRAVDDLAELRAWVPQSIASRCELKMFGHEHVANQIEGFARSIHADLMVATEPSSRTTADVWHGTFAARLLQHGECPVLTVNSIAALAAPHFQRREQQTATLSANH